MRSSVQARSIVRGILQRSPCPPAAMFKLGRLLGQPLSAQISGPQTGSRGKHAAAQVLGKPLVNPKHIVEYRLLKIRSSEAGWTAIFAVPGMNALMRYQVILALHDVFVLKPFFPTPIN